jgi:hypothetical protein
MLSRLRSYPADRYRPMSPVARTHLRGTRSRYSTAWRVGHGWSVLVGLLVQVMPASRALMDHAAGYDCIRIAHWDAHACNPPASLVSEFRYVASWHKTDQQTNPASSALWNIGYHFQPFSRARNGHASARKTAAGFIVRSSPNGKSNCRRLVAKRDAGGRQVTHRGLTPSTRNAAIPMLGIKPNVVPQPTANSKLPVMGNQSSKNVAAIAPKIAQPSASRNQQRVETVVHGVSQCLCFILNNISRPQPASRGC